MNQLTTGAASAPTTYNAAQMDLIRHTVASDTNDHEFNLFIEVCKRVRLDPFRRQIYAVVYNKDNSDKRKMSIITGIDGFRAIAARNGNYRPDENEPEYVFDETLKSDTNPKGLVKTAVSVMKFGPDNQWHGVKGWAHWDAFAPLKEIWAWDQDAGKKLPSGDFRLDKSGNWYRMPFVMLPKCAEAQALRRGWPEDLSGIYIAEEMHQADAQDQSATEAIEHYRKEQVQKRLNIKDGLTLDMCDGQALLAVPFGEVFDTIAGAARTWSSSTEINVFRNRNQRELQRYWTECKNDALGLRRLLDTRCKELDNAA